jgi:hypothetical protein
MKPAAVVEAMICAFSAIVDVSPPRSQRSVIAILNAALVDAIEDADARKVVECLAYQRGIDDRPDAAAGGAGGDGPGATPAGQYRS